MNELIEILNKKKIYSRFSGKIVNFLESFDECLEKGEGVWSDGLNMIDFYDNAEDDIQQMICKYKCGRWYVMEDFYSSHHAFDDGEKFLKDIDRLIANRDDNEKE